MMRVVKTLSGRGLNSDSKSITEMVIFWTIVQKTSGFFAQTAIARLLDMPEVLGERQSVPVRNSIDSED